MTMSRDRVVFKLGGRRGTFITTSRTEFPVDIQAAQKAFNLNVTDCASIDEMQATIICRPSQFARFLIYRNQMGGTNDFKGLEAKLIPAANDLVLDVSKKETF